MGRAERLDGGAADRGEDLMRLYDDALPHVYGYLIRRCGQVALAEDLTAQTFLAAVSASRRDPDVRLSVPWLVAVARNKLVDHWRRRAREERGLAEVPNGDEASEDPWDAHVDGLRARTVLDGLASHHRAALTLRYVDDLPVPKVAELLDRTVHATEALLVRARSAFRRAYEQSDDDLDAESGTNSGAESDDTGPSS